VPELIDSDGLQSEPRLVVELLPPTACQHEASWHDTAVAAFNFAEADVRAMNACFRIVQLGAALIHIPIRRADRRVGQRDLQGVDLLAVGGGVICRTCSAATSRP
jgi:hypothetical protein